MKFFMMTVLLLITGDLFASNLGLKKSEKELQCMALNIYFEARGEPVTGQLAVAMVTMNRVKSKRFPSSICGVVWQRKQFSWTHDGRSDQPTDQKAWKLAKEIADFAYYKYDKLKTMSNGVLDLTKGALHYYAPKFANPYWAKHKQVTLEIGGHVFLAENS